MFDMNVLSPDCEVKYECTSVTRVDGNLDYHAPECDIDFYPDGNNFYFLANMEDYRNGRFAPGQYTLTMRGTAVSNPSYSHEVSVVMELADICDPPAILKVKSDVKMSYTVASESGAYANFDDIFEIEPYVCNYQRLLGPEGLINQIPDTALQVNFMDEELEIMNRGDDPGPGDYVLYLVAESTSRYAKSTENAISVTANIALKFE